MRNELISYEFLTKEKEDCVAEKNPKSAIQNPKFNYGNTK